ncbi:MAG: hypothetical protein IIC53_13625 [Proteobacteria bacterium]|nr:hypothetical protein [Pseudomonadota bacterium]
MVEKVRGWMELWCLAVGAYLTGYIAYLSGQMAWESYVLDYRSDGLVGIPYFIPQGAMVLGLGVLFIRLIDELVQLVRTGEPLHFRTSETSPSQESANDMTGDASGKRER